MLLARVGTVVAKIAWLRAGENDTTVNCEVVKTVSIGSDG